MTKNLSEYRNSHEIISEILKKDESVFSIDDFHEAMNALRNSRWIATPTISPFIYNPNSTGTITTYGTSTTIGTTNTFISYSNNTQTLTA